MEELLFRINFTLKVIPGASKKVSHAFSVSFIAVLQALGCTDVEVFSEKQHKLYPNLDEEKKEG